MKLDILFTDLPISPYSKSDGVRELDLPAKNFGILIAYVLPGFVTLWGLSTEFEVVRAWLMGTENYNLSIGGVLYVSAAAITIGMILNAVRWMLVDQVFLLTGLKKPDWDAIYLVDRLHAFDRMVEDHFCYYQFYANTALGSAVAFGVWRFSDSSAAVPVGIPEVCFLFLEATLLISSRDALERYYTRTSSLLKSSSKEEMAS